MKKRTNIRFIFVIEPGDIVTAICPDEGFCYSHLGQHSNFSPHWVRQCCKEAKFPQYAALLSELENVVGYKVEDLNLSHKIIDFF